MHILHPPVVLQTSTNESSSFPVFNPDRLGIKKIAVKC